MTIEEFLGKLDGVKKTSTGWTARCKAHDDKRNSLSVREGKSGKILIRCFRGCQTDAIDAALGITWRDRTPAKEPAFKIVKTYDYTSEDGTLLYQKVRQEPKGFFQRRPDGHGGWINKLEKWSRRVLYRLDELVRSP